MDLAGWAAGVAVGPESVMDLSDDIAYHPMMVFDQKGRRVRTVYPRRKACLHCPRGRGVKGFGPLVSWITSPPESSA